MPLLNPPDVLPEGMRFVLRAVWAAGDRVPVDDVVQLVTPEGIVEALDGDQVRTTAKPSASGRTIVECSLAALRTNGLVRQERSGERIVSLAESVGEYWSSWEDVTARSFATYIRERVIPRAVPGFAEADPGNDSGPDDLARALTVLLAIPDPLSPVDGFDRGTKAFRDYQSEWFGSDQASWIVRNVERYRSLQRWVPYLGYGRVDQGGGLIMDGRVALAPLVNDLVSTELPVRKFLDQLGESAPITDRGGLGSVLRERIPGAPDDEITPGLALTLSLLQVEKKIVLSSKSDAKSMTFPLSSSEQPRYSHIAPGPERN